MKRYLIAIDPGTTESGVCIIDTDNLKPIAFGKIVNEDVPSWILKNKPKNGPYQSMEDTEAVIERMQGNSKPVGSEVFLTCEWIGRFDVELHDLGITQRSYILRWEEYRRLCAKEYARNDRGIRCSLADRFAYGQKNYGKGTVKNPGWFYGFFDDIWQAYAIGVAFIDKTREESHEK